MGGAGHGRVGRWGGVGWGRVMYGRDRVEVVLGRVGVV